MLWSPSGSAADSYTVTSNPGGITTTVDGAANSATVTGLGYLVRYTFTVTGTNSLGTGPASAPSDPITPGAPGGPYRQSDVGELANGDVTAGQPLRFNLGNDRVHAPGLSAVVVNLTVSQATTATDVQVVERGQVEQTISVGAGLVESSVVVIPAPAELTQASVQVTSGTAHVQIDSVGFFTDPRTVRDHSGLLTMVAPAPLLDATVASGSTTDVAVLGQGGIPSAHVGEVLLNVTATSAAGSGALSLVPTGSDPAGITTLGFVAGETTANLAIVAVPSSGSISIVDSFAGATVHVEVLGWFSDGTDSTAFGGLYNSLSPARLVDTSASGGPIAAGATLNVPIYGQGGAPPVTATAPPTSVIVTITAIAPTGAGSITAAGAAVVDYGAGETASRTAVVHLASDGSVTIGVIGSATNITVDLVAYFAGDLIVPGSTKVMTPDLLASITQLSASSDFVTFKPGTQVSPFIQVDDVITGGISPATPQGFLLRVLSITTQPDGTVVLGTRQAALSEALTAYSIDAVIVPSFSGMRSNHPLGVASPITGGLTVNPCPGPPANTSIDPRCPELTLGTMVALANAVAAGTFPQPNLDGSVHLFPVPWADLALTDLEVQVLPHLHIEYNFFSNTAKASFAWSVGFKLALELAVSKDLLSSGLTLASVTFSIGPPFPVPIGPMVVMVTPTLTLALTLDASISAGLRFAYHFDRWSQVTESYDGSAFHTSNLEHTYVNGFDPPAFEADAEAKIALHAGPGLSIWGNALTAGVDFNRFLKGTATVTCTPQPSCFPNPWWTLSSGVCIGVFLHLQLFFVSNKFFHVDLACVEQVLLQAPGPHLNVVITPSSATVPRFHVQHFHAVVSNSPSGVRFSVDGGDAHGTLSNMLLTTDVDYTAPGTPGDYKLLAAALDDTSSVGFANIHVPADPPSKPTNVGAALAGLTSVTVTWAAPSDNGGAPITDYKVVSSDGTTIDAGTSTSVTFTGLTPGNTYTFSVFATNQANLTSAAGVSPAITIPAAGPMSVVPTSLNFGNITLGQSSQPQTVVVTADGVPLVISTVSLAGTNPGEFAIQNDLCSGQTLQPGAACSFAVQYIPTQQIVASATVSIKDSDTTSPQTVTLSASSPVPAVSGVVQVFDISMVDSQTGYAVEGALGTVVVKTTDGGKTWNRLVLPIFDQVLDIFSGGSVRFIDANHGFIAAFRRLQPSGQVDFVLATSDGGQTWQQINLPNATAPESIWFTDAFHGWVLSEVAGPPAPPGSLVNSALVVVNVTTDGGLTWTRHSLPDPIIAGTPGCIGEEANVSVAFADSLNGWMSAAVLCFAPNLTITAQGALFWTTTDGGTTWTPHQPAGATEVFDRIQVTGPSQVRQLAVVKVSSTFFEQVLVSSDDGGASFSIIPLPAQKVQIPAVTFSDSTHGVFVTGDGHVGRTTDGGATWQVSTLPRFASSAGHITSYGYRAVASPDGTNIWVTGSVSYGFPEAGFIEMSSDGGATWTVQLLGSGA